MAYKYSIKVESHFVILSGLGLFFLGPLDLFFNKTNDSITMDQVPQVFIQVLGLYDQDPALTVRIRIYEAGIILQVLIDLRDFT